jgi:hypothetical protein
MKKLLAIIIMLAMVFSAGIVLAEEFITLPNGEKIPLTGLTSSDKQNLMTYVDKIAKAQEAAKLAIEQEGVLEEIAKAAKDPKALNEWRVLITGTIKDIANDLNVSVNEFIKTPAGIGVAALIIYKVAGKEILAEAMGIILVIPFWAIMMIILAVFQKKYFGNKLVYDIVTEDKKTTKTNPRKIQNYDFNTDDSKLGAAVVIYGSMGLVTVLAFLVVFF